MRCSESRRRTSTTASMCGSAGTWGRAPRRTTRCSTSTTATSTGCGLAWQHLFPASGYLPTAGGPAGHNLNDVMQHLTTASATPANCLDYRRTRGFIYDTDPPLVDLMTPTVTFQDVPTLETTWRAAVFHVRAGSTIHLEVVSEVGRRRRTPSPRSAGR